MIRIAGGAWTAGVAAVVLAAAAIGVLVWVAVRPAAPESASSPTFDDQQRETARRSACAALSTVRDGVTANVGRPVPDGDPTGALAVAANSRLALFSGGSYLVARIGPATPPDLAASMTRFGDALMDIGIAAAAGLPNSDPAVTARLREVDALTGQLSAACR